MCRAIPVRQAMVGNDQKVKCVMGSKIVSVEHREDDSLKGYFVGDHVTTIRRSDGSSAEGRSFSEKESYARARGADLEKQNSKK